MVLMENGVRNKHTQKLSSMTFEKEKILTKTAAGVILIT